MWKSYAYRFRPYPNIFFWHFPNGAKSQQNFTDTRKGKKKKKKQPEIGVFNIQQFTAFSHCAIEVKDNKKNTRVASILDDNYFLVGRVDASILDDNYFLVGRVDASVFFILKRQNQKRKDLSCAKCFACATSITCAVCIFQN